MDLNLTDEYILRDASVLDAWNDLVEIDMDGVHNLDFANIEEIDLVNFEQVASSGSGAVTQELETSNSVPDATNEKKKRGRPKKANVQNPKNAERCQQQRNKAKEDDAKEKEKLEQLQAENEQLRIEEEELGKVADEVWKIYLELIRTGQIAMV